MKVKGKECSFNLITRMLRLQLKIILDWCVTNCADLMENTVKKQQIFLCLSLLVVYMRQIVPNWRICMDIDKHSGRFQSRINSFVPRKHDWWFYYCGELFLNCVDYSVRTCFSVVLLCRFVCVWKYLHKIITCKGLIALVCTTVKVGLEKNVWIFIP